MQMQNAHVNFLEEERDLIKSFYPIHWVENLHLDNFKRPRTVALARNSGVMSRPSKFLCSKGSRDHTTPTPRNHLHRHRYHPRVIVQEQVQESMIDSLLSEL